MGALTKAQRRVLECMGEVPNALRNGDEGTPQWWIEGGDGVRGSTANNLLRRGYIRLSGHWGGQPGVLGFTITVAGRQALSQGGGDE